VKFPPPSNSLPQGEGGLASLSLDGRGLGEGVDASLNLNVCSCLIYQALLAKDVNHHREATLIVKMG